MNNREIAQEISNRIGNSPVPFNSVYSIALQIYNELGGEETQFDSVYSILLEILPLTGSIAHIDDSTISSGSTWSSEKIADEIQQGGGQPDLMVNVTYSQLKSLRDNSQLIKGQQYRITDYVTTTAQEGTISDEHQFDIIITADDVNKLNENDRAIQHVFDTSGVTTYYKWMYDNTGDAWILSNEDSYTNEVSGTCPLENTPMYGMEYYDNVYPIEGVIGVDDEVPYTPQVYRKAIIITDGDTLYLGDYIDEDTWNYWVENGDVEGDYPEWFIGKYFLDEGDIFTYDGTYQEGADSYFDNSKLESWELKYCLDNDTNRFSWAQVGNAGYNVIKAYAPANAATYVCVRYAEKDDISSNKYAWVLVNDGIDVDINEVTDFSNYKYLPQNAAEPYCIVFTSSQNPSMNDTAYIYYYDNEDEEYNEDEPGTIQDYSPSVGEVPSGKGVIYYMKDEWNNQVYFDFKNIRIWDEEMNVYSYLFGRDDGDYTLDGSDYNNIINGYIEDGITHIDTELLFYNVQNYQKVYNEGNGIKIENQTISISDNLSNTLEYVTYMINVLENPNDYTSQYFTLEAASDNCEITFSAYWNIEISRDLLNWKIPQNSIIATLNNGEKLYIRSKDGVINPSYNNKPISFSEPCYAYGNIISLIYGKNFNSTQDKKLVNKVFYRTFKNNINLLSHSNKKMIIGANTIGQQACREMFYGCTSLITAPELPATTLERFCYDSMFYGCTSLITAPELPATTLADNCYSWMFYNCSSLTTAPALPATTLVDYCYHQMFYNCSSLTTAPELPATTLVDYCYNYMFDGCTSLNYIKCLAANGINQNNSTTHWVRGVASSGTFVKDANVTWATGDSGIPTNWTVQDV